MASKINVKHSADITGILNIDEDSEKMTVEVEDVENPIDLKKFFKEFNGKDVKITIGHKIEM